MYKIYVLVFYFIMSSMMTADAQPVYAPTDGTSSHQTLDGTGADFSPIGGWQTFDFVGQGDTGVRNGYVIGAHSDLGTAFEGRRGSDNFWGPTVSVPEQNGRFTPNDTGVPMALPGERGSGGHTNIGPDFSVDCGAGIPEDDRYINRPMIFGTRNALANILCTAQVRSDVAHFYVRQWAYLAAGIGIVILGTFAVINKFSWRTFFMIFGGLFILAAFQRLINFLN